MVSRCKQRAEINSRRWNFIGVYITDRWRRYDEFLADMGPAPDGLGIIKVDNAGIYCKQNCYWGTVLLKPKNPKIKSPRVRRANTENINVSELARKHHLPANTVHVRLRRGWTIERALNTPLKFTVDDF